MAFPGLPTARRKETVVAMVTKQPTYPRSLYQAPKQPTTSRQLTIEEKAERYDQLVNLKAAKRVTRQQIARLNRQLEQLDLEENKVLESDLAGYTNSKTIDLGPCSLCNFEKCTCEV
jgi:hypothetical protein